jgi:hypothetical protein
MAAVRRGKHLKSAMAAGLGTDQHHPHRPVT